MCFKNNGLEKEKVIKMGRKHTHHRSPKQHVRTLKSGKRVTVNRGVSYAERKKARSGKNKTPVGDYITKSLATKDYSMFNKRTETRNNYQRKLDSISWRDLDDFELNTYSRGKRAGASHRDMLHVMINTVEGDYSQLSPKLKEAAKIRDEVEKKGK